MRSKTPLTMFAASLLLFAACTSSPTATPAGTPAPASAAPGGASSAPSAAAGACAQGATGSQTVTISNFAFSPATLSVPVGTTVTFTNNDNTTHTATANDGSFDCGPISGGQSLSFTFTTAGSFDFHCKIHPSMTGKITVS